jgi:hypothetical protein
MSSRRAYDGHWRASIPARRKSNSVAPAFVVCASTPASATTNMSVSLCPTADLRAAWQLCARKGRWPVAVRYLHLAGCSHV